MLNAYDMDAATLNNVCNKQRANIDPLNSWLETHNISQVPDFPSFNPGIFEKLLSLHDFCNLDSRQPN